MVIGVAPASMVAVLAIVGTKLPALFRSAKNVRPFEASSSEPPLASDEA